MSWRWGVVGYSRLVMQLTFVSRFFNASTETSTSRGSLNQEPKSAYTNIVGTKPNLMPTPRQSCSRCRKDKARCSYIIAHESCTRCIQRHLVCELPVGRTRSTQDLNADGADGEQLQTAALNQRIGKIEELLIELKSALPLSARNANVENRPIDQPVDSGPSNFDSPIDHSSRLGPMSDLPKRCSLPTMEEGQALLTDYLRDFNSRVPLLAPEAIVSHMRDCYSGAAKGFASSWVLTYVVLGIAHRLRALDPSVRSDETSKSEQYLDKCLNSFSNVLLEEPNERIVQCLLGIAIMLQDSPKSHRVLSFVSIALRMAQELGYNEAGPSGSNQRLASYLFWIAFSMDANLSMCALRPNTQKYSEISINVPQAAGDHDWWDMHSGDDGKRKNASPGPNFLFLNCSLATIQAQALEEVFSPKVNLQPIQYSFALNNVYTKLAEWRKDTQIASAEGLQNSELLHLTMLEASYFRTLYQLVAAQQIGVISFRYDLFSHVALRVQKHSQGSTFFEDARRLLSLLALPPIGILSLNR
jgi:hypothetical protein